MSAVVEHIDVEVMLLRGSVEIRRGALVYAFPKSPKSASLVADLALAGPEGRSSTELAFTRDETGRGNVNTMVTRIVADIEEKLGIRSIIVARPSNHGYRLAVAPERIDARRFIAAAMSNDPEAAREAMRLWTGGPPDFLKGPVRARLISLHDAHASLRATLSPRYRVLIVDDQVAYDLAEQLSTPRISVVPVTNVRGFRDRLETLDADFDLLIVDVSLNSTAGFTDQDGLKIADDVVSRDLKIPMLAITYRPPRGGSLEQAIGAIIDRGFFSVMHKNADAPDANMDPSGDLVRFIEQVLSEEPGASSVAAIRRRLSAWYEEARDVNGARNGRNSAGARSIEVAIGNLRKTTETPPYDLVSVRKAVRDFQAGFLGR